VWQCSIGNFFEQFEGFSEHGIFHGIIIFCKNKSLKMKDKNGLFIIEWGRRRIQPQKYSTILMMRYTIG